MSHSLQKIPLLQLIAGLLLLFSVSCAGLQQPEKAAETTLQYVSVRQDSSLLEKYAPAFILEDTAKSYNRIGTPAVRDNGDGSGAPDVYIDPFRPTIYSMIQKFEEHGRAYTNLIYRIHFEKIPFIQLTAGRNVGLIVIITLNQDNQPLLLTTVHTCGCYLAIVPTSNLAPKTYPESWNVGGQDVYGEHLPGLIKINQPKNDPDKFVFRIRAGTHRIMNLDLLPAREINAQANFVAAELQPMAALRNLPFNDSVISFFETEGARKGYVRNSHKPLERLLMSWWTMDWRIGEDKDLGPSEKTGTTFYTSLKFWAWDKSDLWNFAGFLNYWGWKF
jgi:hypothetical protein